jgi:nucleoside-diphosphate-sugar epimerase
MKVLVTGATGFIGRTLCGALVDAGFAVRALLRPGSRLELEGQSAAKIARFEGDVTVRESLDGALEGVDAVVHLAGARSASRPETFHRVNAVGTENLGQACSAQGVGRLVFLSSLAAQGPTPSGGVLDEPGSESPIGPYGHSKLAAEKALARLGAECRVTVLRPGIVYGRYDRELLGWSRMLRLRLLPFPGDLELSFVHVDDLSSLVLSILRAEAPGFGPYFVSDGRPQTMDHVADLLERALQRPSLRLRLPRGLLRRLSPAVDRVLGLTGVAPTLARLIRDYSVTGWVCSPRRIQAEFGFEPARSFDASFRRVFEWYRKVGWLDD